MNKSILQKLEAEIDQNYEQDKAAIKRLLKYEENRDVIITKLAPPVISQPKSQIIEEIILAYEGDFTIQNIASKLKERLGKEPNHIVRSMIGPVINKLRQRNPPELIEVMKGKGSRSGRYRRST